VRTPAGGPRSGRAPRRLAEELREQRARDVGSLDREVVHLGVELHALAVSFCMRGRCAARGQMNSGNTANVARVTAIPAGA